VDSDGVVDSGILETVVVDWKASIQQDDIDNTNSNIIIMIEETIPRNINSTLAVVAVPTRDLLLFRFCR
jgi:hypothetical protein